jgi:hypothetical protein
VSCRALKAEADAQRGVEREKQREMLKDLKEKSKADKEKQKQVGCAVAGRRAWLLGIDIMYRPKPPLCEMYLCQVHALAGLRKSCVTSAGRRPSLHGP